MKQATENPRYMVSHARPEKQRGAILIVAMIFLLLLSVLAITTMRMGTLQVYMAGNEQARVEAFEKAQAIVSSLDGNDANFNVVGSTGYRVCSAGHSDADNCDLTNLVVDATVDTAVTSAGQTVEYDITELYSIDAMIPVSVSLATGAGADVTFWGVRGYYDDRGNRQGESEIVLGSMRIYPSADSQKSLSEDGSFDNILQQETISAGP